MKTLRLILGDQLNIKHPWFKSVDDDIVYAIFEMRQETDYVTHHIQKVIGFFAAMRQFADDLKAAGHQVVSSFPFCSHKVTIFGPLLQFLQDFLVIVLVVGCAPHDILMVFQFFKVVFDIFYHIIILIIPT